MIKIRIIFFLIMILFREYFIWYNFKYNFEIGVINEWMSECKGGELISE